MPTLVIEHLKASELPEQWAQQLNTKNLNRPSPCASRPAPEPAAETATTFVTDDPAFGIRRDREDMADVEAYLRKLRAPRYMRD